MDPHAHIQSTSGRRPQAAAALLMWLGVLAVLAILGAFLLPALIREIDYGVARQESATLGTFGNALRSAVQRLAYIPAETNWAEFVAAEAGFAPTSVATNPRGQPRLLLIDTSGWFTNVALPYRQAATGSGTAVVPLNARVLIASSLGTSLPLAAGPLSASEFSALWQAAEGTTNFPTTGLWAGWTGRSDDVKLERVNLSSLFVSLRAVTYTPPANTPRGLYSIDNNSPLPAPYLNQGTTTPPTYLIQGTLLKLYSETAQLDSTQVLTRDGSFIYQNGIWKSSVGGGAMPAGVDIGGVVNAFLNAVPNTRALNGATQQKLVVQSMMDYMSNYNAWADGGFVDATLKSYLLTKVQPHMIVTLQDIFQGVYYPTNGSGPQ